MAHRGSSAWREANFGPPCKSDKTLIEDWLPGVNLYVDARCYEAFVVLADVIQSHGYEVRSKDTGSYNCRKIKGTDAWSSHAWGIAVDINWSTNPYRRDKLVTDMPREMVEAIEALRTKGGAQVFRWGGDWDGRPDTPHSNYDAMHYEVFATPEELASGIDYAAMDTPPVRPKPKPKPEEPKAEPKRSWDEAVLAEQPVLSEARTPQRLEATKRAQALVNTTRRKDRQIKEDGYFGEKTTAAVRSFQSGCGLTVDGIVGRNTWGALTGRMVTLSEKRTPQKLDATKRAQALINVERRSDQQIAEDGYFGEKTTRATELFQKNHRLSVDGIVGPNTWTELMGG